MRLNHQLIEHVARAKLSIAAQSICVGLSGGIDSVVLLHILRQLDPAIALTAIHVNHNLSPNAATWSEFCQSFCAKLGVPLQIETINLKRLGGESLENTARKARQNILLQSPAAAIALAHHQNDQVETILSQLLRGSDLHNIGAMRAINERRGKLFWRPLLQISRIQIEEYAASFGLEYIVDESNLDTKFLRNFIRHDVLPLLKRWDSNITQKILNLNVGLQKILAITDEVAVADLGLCCCDGKNINIAAFKHFSCNRQINLLSQFIKCNMLPLPSSKQLLEFAQQASTSGWDKKPQLRLDANTSLVKYKQNIYLSSVSANAQGIF